jgi:MFS superfamily sulfate permease-like transporter
MNGAHRTRHPFGPPATGIDHRAPITDVDTTAADILADLDEELSAAGTFLVFAGLKDPVRAKLERYQLIGPLDPGHFFPTIEAAVDAFRRKTGADWTSTVDASA